MGEITDLDITGQVKAKSGSTLGAAHEHIVTGILMRLGFDVSVSSVRTRSYDLLLIVYTNEPDSPEKIIKAEVKTCQNNSLPLTGGGRGGVDRIYISGVKTYKYTEKDCDLMIGLIKETLDLYLFPIRFGSLYGKSVSVKKLAALKNRWEILVNWNDNYLESLRNQLRR